MRKNFLIFAVILGLSLLAACSSPAGPTRNKMSETVTQEAAPPMNYGDDGAVYSDATGTPMLQILSMDEQQLNLKRLDVKMIYHLSRVPKSSRLKYSDAAHTTVIFESDALLNMEFRAMDGATSVRKVLTTKSH